MLRNTVSELIATEKKDMQAGEVSYGVWKWISEPVVEQAQMTQLRGHHSFSQHATT